MLRTPIWRIGGKGQMVAKLARLIPEDYDFYVEPFFGGGSLFFYLSPARVETINDLDGAVMDFYRVVQDAGSFARFQALAEVTPYNREQWGRFRDEWEAEEDEVVRAWKWWTVCRQSFSGLFGRSWSTVCTASSRGMALNTSAWRSAIANLPLVHERLQRAQIESVDALTVIARYAVEGAFMYCDPPYVSTTRVAGGYVHEMTDADHAALVETLLGCPAQVMVSGYQHETYEALDGAGWWSVSFDVISYAAAKTRASGIQGEGSATEKCPRVETVWGNYPLGGSAKEWLEENEFVYQEGAV